MSDYYDLRRSTIVDATAFVGFAAGLVAAMAMRWSILNVNFRYGNFARAVFDFAKTMLWWGIVGGVFGLGVGVVLARLWQRTHMWRRRKREESNEAGAATLPRIAAAAPAPALASSSLRAPSRSPAAVSASTPLGGKAPSAPHAPPAGIRYDDSGFPAEQFLTLARRVWSNSYDSPQAVRALERTLNVGAWDEARLVGAVRVLTDGYFFATVPEILVDPAYRKRGIGRELMRRALALSPSGTLVIGATTESLGFFQRLGCELAPMGFVMRTREAPSADRPA